MTNVYRTDSRGRRLRSGELQRRDGRYEYRTVDESGVRHSVYSWRLLDSDELPFGKKPCPSLRSMESEPFNNLLSASATLNELFCAYLDSRIGLRDTTRTAYLRTYNAHVRGCLGSMSAAEIKHSHIRQLYLSIIGKGYSVSVLKTVQSLLHPVFQRLMQDELIVHDPTLGALAELRREAPRSNGRCALTSEQQNVLLDYLSLSSSQYCRWRGLIVTLLGTGMRINEALALQISDCNFEAREIYIRRSLARVPVNGSYVWHIYPPKTENGVRTVPMLDAVYNALSDEIASHSADNTACIDGCGSFVFLNHNGGVYSASSVAESFDKHLRPDCNAWERCRAEREGRSPIVIEKLTPHILRHSFCTRLIELGVEPANVKKLMGHSRISTTLDTYTHVSDNAVRLSLDSVEGRFRLT